MRAPSRRSYASPRRRFARVDLERFPEIAREFGIDTSLLTKQLPTIALFYRGREVRRLPSFNDDGKVSRVRFTEVRKHDARSSPYPRRGTPDATSWRHRTSSRGHFFWIGVTKMQRSFHAEKAQKRRDARGSRMPRILIPSTQSN